jgi:hypothetical protein
LGRPSGQSKAAKDKIGRLPGCEISSATPLYDHANAFVTSGKFENIMARSSIVVDDQCLQVLRFHAKKLSFCIHDANIGSSHEKPINFIRSNDVDWLNALAIS